MTNWADAKKNEENLDIVKNYLKTQINEALPESMPKCDVSQVADGKYQFKVEARKHEDAKLTKFNELTHKLKNEPFKSDVNVENFSYGDEKLKFAVTGKANDLVDGINIEFISKYLKEKVENIDVEPSPTAKVTATEKTNGQHQFHVEIIRNNLEPYSEETRKFHSDVIKMM
jgi:hypothetical protein